jgi:hypothetical protein
MQCLKGDLPWRRRPAGDLFVAHKTQIAGETPAPQASETRICEIFFLQKLFFSRHHRIRHDPSGIFS